MSPRDRDEFVPKHPRATTDPAELAGAAAVSKPAYEEVTGRYDTLEELEAARRHREVMRSQRAMSIKIAAGNRVVRDELRASRDERERRRATELERARIREAARERRARVLDIVMKRVAPILVAIGAILSAYAAVKGKM